jgi:hypothetical protein
MELMTVGQPTTRDRSERWMKEMTRDIAKLLLAFALWATAVVLVLV